MAELLLVLVFSLTANVGVIGIASPEDIEPVKVSEEVDPTMRVALFNG